LPASGILVLSIPAATITTVLPGFYFFLAAALESVRTWRFPDSYAEMVNLFSAGWKVFTSSLRLVLVPVCCFSPGYLQLSSFRLV
jgi:hypothetical protein